MDKRRARATRILTKTFPILRRCSLGSAALNSIRASAGAFDAFSQKFEVSALVHGRRSISFPNRSFAQFQDLVSQTPTAEVTRNMSDFRFTAGAKRIKGYVDLFSQLQSSYTISPSPLSCDPACRHPFLSYSCQALISARKYI